MNETGGVLGRHLDIVKADDDGSVTRGQLVAQAFAENSEMVAVIGHQHSAVSIPVSIMYEYYGLLMLSPTSTSPKLTRQGYRRIFRVVPDDDDCGKQLAMFCRQQGYRHLLIYQQNDAYGEGLGNAFERECELLGLEVRDRLAYDSLSGLRVFRKDLTYWKENFEFDAIFLAGNLPQAGVVISEARKLGVTVPIIGGDGLDGPELIRIAGAAANGTFFASNFDPHETREEVQAFCRAFQRRYGGLPESGMAALGYDAVKILAHAMHRAGTTVPDRVAVALRSIQGWTGVTGSHTFNTEGDVIGKRILINAVRNGEVEIIVPGT